MSALDYERMTLDPQDLSFGRQVAQFEIEGWEIEAHEGSRLCYLRRHRRVPEIIDLFSARGRRLKLALLPDGTWKASVSTGFADDDPSETAGATPLEAAEAALAEYGDA